MNKPIGITLLMAVLIAVGAMLGVTISHFRRAPDVKTPRPETQATPFPIPEFINPFETEADRAEKERRKGFVLEDGQGNRWGRIYRTDNADVTKGLPPELTQVWSGDIRPSMVKQPEGWIVRWAAPSPTPTP